LLNSWPESTSEVLLADLRSRGHSGTDCGLYALLAASNAIGAPINYTDLFSAEKTHAFKDKTGISAENLAQIANQHGIYATELNGLSVQDLSFATIPVLILLDSGKGSNKHWIAFFGIEDGGSKALIYDSLDSDQHRSLSEIALVWGGKALLVGKSAEVVSSCSKELQIVSACRTSMLMAVPILIVFVMNVFVVPFAVAQSRFSRKNVEACSIALAVCVLACWLGLTQGVVQLHQNLVSRNCWDAVPIPDLDVEYIREVLPTRSCILVDCRLPIDFSFGHIPGAKNVPVTCSWSEWNRLSQTFGNEEKIILYCQSANCGWAATMQKRLRCMGRKVAVLSGGYERYTQDKSNQDSNENH
jgi:rhodanese-related sulfurtransferase